MTSCAKEDLARLPPGWAWTTLGDIATILPGFGFPERLQGRKEGDIPFFKVRDISRVVLSGEKLARTSDNYVSVRDCEQMRARPLPSGAVVFAKIGEAIRLNRRAILAQDSLVDNNVMGVFAEPVHIDNLYLFYYLTTQRLGDASRATTVPSVRKSDVESISAPIAPVSEQRRIVAKIEELFSDLDAGVEALKKAKAEIKRYRQSVLKCAFEAGFNTKTPRHQETEELITTELPRLPDGWAWTTIREIGDSILGKMLDKAKHTEGIRLPYLRNINVRWGSVDTSDLEQMFFKESEFERYGLKKGDVLICEGGEPGRAAVWDGRDVKMKFQKAIHRVRLHGEVLPQWLALQLRHDAEMGRLERYFTGSTIKHFTGQGLARYAVRLAPIAEQQQIVSEIERRFSVADEAEKVIDRSLKQAETLRQSILKRAFEGRLVSQDPNDEPAEKLLERIRAEKEKREAGGRAGRKRGKG